MPLFFWVSGNLVRPYVKGWDANAMDKHRSPLDLDRRKSPGGGSADMIHPPLGTAAIRTRSRQDHK